jgi:hypothetical protein
MIDVSVIASANRPEWWERVYRSLTSNKLKFEVIFVGDVAPKFKLPNNFKWIYATVRPAQCYQIALWEAQGEAIQLTADDAEFSPKALDILYWHWGHNNNLITGPRCIENGKDITDIHHFLAGDKNTPIMVPFMFAGKEFFDSVGVDKRFKGGQWENDITAIHYTRGGEVDICNDASVFVHHKEAHNDNNGGSKIRSNWQSDRKFFMDMWVENGNIRWERKEPLSLFKKDKLITSVEQC